MRRALLATLLLLASPVSAQTSSPSPAPSPPPSPSLGSARAEIERLSRELELATEKEAALVDAINQIEERMTARAESLARIQADAEAARKDAEASRERMETLEERLGTKRRWLKNRLRSLYVHGRPGYLKVLFAADSYADLVRRSKFSRILARRDSALVAEIKKDLAAAAESRREYEEDHRLLEELLSTSRAANEELEIERTFRESLLQQVKSDVADLAALKKKLEDEAARMGAHIAAIPSSSPSSARPFVEAKGKLLPPLGKPVVRLPFGPYTHPTVGRMMHQGIAYDCGIGEPVKAVYDGRVEMSAWFSTYGQVLVIDHGDGWRSLYAHNSRLLKRKGESVREGDVIAETGATGSLTGPVLFFALYRHGEPVDPATWFVP